MLFLLISAYGLESVCVYVYTKRASFSGLWFDTCSVKIREKGVNT